MLSKKMTLLLGAVLGAGALSLAAPTHAHAFCGFYVAGADQNMYNNATMVVMMRQGTKTVLSMRNNYQGPPQDFAMVIPVPQVLQEEHVKVLKDELFERVDALAAPRLVEYFEHDPCAPPLPRVEAMSLSPAPTDVAAPSADLGVQVEAEFDVGEYNVVVLSAKESHGLETWLKQQRYNIPNGAAPVLKPYIQTGHYFFVAKVDPKKVSFNHGQATLSPLRFHYDSDDFYLPVRLGLLNADGHQDLLVHILADQRYEVANYPNVTIPTNLLVKQAVRENFAEFYAALLDRTMEETPKSVVTEYAWDATTCDPCPVPALNPAEIKALGGDVLADSATQGRTGMHRPMPGAVLTRLHARYTKEELGEDLVFRSAPPLLGGRGTPSGREPQMKEQGASVTGTRNNFQGRYIMLNYWEGEVECASPKYGLWGGPSGKDSKPTTKPATDTAFAERGAFKLASAIAQEEIPGLKLKGQPDDSASKAANPKTEAPKAEEPQPPSPVTGDQDAAASSSSKKKKNTGCASAPASAPSGAPLTLLGGLLGLIGLWRRRKAA